MGLVDLFFSVRGRINRAQYWLGSFVTGFVLMAGLVAASFAAGGAAENATKSEAAMAGVGAFALLFAPVLIIVCWTGLAIQIKRFHDRGRPWWFVLLPFVPALFIGMAIAESVARGGSPYQLMASVGPYSVIGWLINLYLFVELGCLSGVDGDNKYGPPPGSARGPVEAPRPSGAVDAASSLCGAQSAMDRAIADQNRPQPAPVRPAPAPAPAFAAAARSPAQPPAPSFGRRVTR